MQVAASGNTSPFGITTMSIPGGGGGTYPARDGSIPQLLNANERKLEDPVRDERYA
jgi:hypothetical protein